MIRKKPLDGWWSYIGTALAGGSWGVQEIVFAGQIPRELANLLYGLSTWTLPLGVVIAALGILHKMVKSGKLGR